MAVTLTFCARLLRLPCAVRVSLIDQCLTSQFHTGRSNKSLRTIAHVSHRRYASTRSSRSQHNGSQSSVNQSEVSHFSALASDWWDPHGSSRLLHLMNPLRHRFIQRCLRYEEPAEPKAKLKYLDIGCGGGIFAETAARLPSTSTVTALDPTEGVIAVARKHQRNDPLLMEPGRLNYNNIAIEDLPLPSEPRNGYDIITVFEVLEHIQHPSPFLATALKHLKPGGWLIGSTIARSATSWLTTNFVAEEVLRMVPRGTHDWNQYINPDELRAWVRQQEQLEDWRCQGVIYVPGVGWKEIDGSEGWGNYFFGMRKSLVAERSAPGHETSEQLRGDHSPDLK